MRGAARSFAAFTAIYARLVGEDPPTYQIERITSPDPMLLFRVTSLPPLPEHLTDEFMTVMMKCRSSLEHIATGLALVQNGNTPLDENVAKQITFPIYDEEHKFRSLEGRISKYFRPQDWRVIEQVQAFADDEAVWGQGFWIRHPYQATLLGIDHFAKLLRHRGIEVVAHGLAHVWPPKEFGGAPVEGGSLAGSFLKVGDEAGRWYFPEGLPVDDPSTEFVGRFLQLVPALGDMILPQQHRYFDGLLIPHLPDFISSCLEVVHGTISVFQPALDSGENPLPVQNLRGQVSD